jgi:hypothetical protein
VNCLYKSWKYNESYKKKITINWINQAFLDRMRDAAKNPWNWPSEGWPLFGWSGIWISWGVLWKQWDLINLIPDWVRTGWGYNPATWWWPVTMNHNWWVVPPTTWNWTDFISQDEYVNEKLSEIHECFKIAYEKHLDSIEKTIFNFTKTRDSSDNTKIKAKYQRAIDKLNEIKELYVNRYKNLFNYNKVGSLEGMVAI